MSIEWVKIAKTTSQPECRPVRSLFDSNMHTGDGGPHSGMCMGTHGIDLSGRFISGEVMGALFTQSGDNSLSTN